MPAITTSLTTQLRRATEAVRDDIAKDGLIALKRVLDNAGFSESDYLKDYEVYSHIHGDGILFEILLKLDSTDVDEKKIEEAKKNSARKEEAKSERTYKIISRGGFNRVSQMRDMRRPAPSALKPAKDSLHKVGDIHSAIKNSGKRKLDHAVAMAMPRDMNIDRAGKLSMIFGKQTRTTKSGEIHFPQGDFQGITKKFMDELKQIIVNKFIPELEHILTNMRRT